MAAVRDLSRAPRFSDEDAIAIDLNRDTSVEAWLPRLAGIDAVVNCAGILQETRGESIDAIHTKAPAALFAACERTGVRRVVQISAISADRDAGTAYAVTKLAADDALRSSSLEWVVLRPSIVLARGAYGGTAAFRGLAALPFAIPVPGDGMQRFQPIWIDDLSRTVALALETDALVRQTLDPVGPDAVTLRDMLEDYRRWLGFPAAPVVRIPIGLVRVGARIADRVGGPLNSTALAQLEHGNTGDFEAFSKATGVASIGWKQALAAHPAHAQDRWHARLFFMRPLLRAALAILWFVSGFAGLFALREWAPLFARELNVPVVAAGAVLAVACIADIVIAMLLVRRWRPQRLALAQVLLILGYTAVASLLWPSLWAEALAPLAKNLPAAAAALVLGAIEEDR